MKIIKIKTPKGWRIGQTLFNFFSWLKTNKGIEDPFHIFDPEFERLYKEFLKTMK